MLTRRVCLLLNAGIVVCSFVESYVFPFAIIKWMIVITKYGGLMNLLRRYKDDYGNDSPSTTLRSKYKYSLQLKTRYKHDIKDDYSVSNVSVVIEESGDCEKRVELSYCGQDCQKIPTALVQVYGAKVQYLDLSYNSIETLRGLDRFHNLQELILDNNKLSDAVVFPYLPYLRTLSLNNNQISDLDGILDKLSLSFPNLTYLSLLSNAACPDQLSDVNKDESDYQRYRYFVIYRLQKLRFLDSRRVTSSEHSESVTRGEFMRVRRPAPASSEDVIDVGSIGINLRPLPVDFSALGKHKGAYGKCQYKYTGKHSEGNRFIVNSDL